MKETDDSRGPQAGGVVDLWVGVGVLGVLLGYAGLLLISGSAGLMPGAAYVVLVWVPAALFLIALKLWDTRAMKKSAAFGLRVALLLALPTAVVLLMASPGGLLCFPLSDRALQRQVESSVGIGRLQEWAVELLQRPEEEIPANSDGRIARKDLPADVAEIAYLVRVDARAEPAERHVFICWGGGFHRWGVLVGPPTFRAESDESQWVRRWRDGVYGYHEIQ